MTFQFTPERMEPKTWKIHVCGDADSIKHGQAVSELLDVSRCYPSGCSSIAEGFQPAMYERLNHNETLKCRVSLVN